jgi:outer membrane biosynthesis protein TonB
MPNHETEGAQARPVWMFMVATAMATTISTLAATAMVKADASEPVAVTCECEAPASAAPVVEAPPVQQIEPPAQQAEPTEEPPPPEAAEPTAEVEPAPKAEVRGSLDKDIIRRIVRAHIGEVRYCYNEGLAHDPELSGRVSVEFVIGAEGKVIRSTAESDMEGEVPECIANAVGRWLFPRPADGKDVAVSYPFVLEPG